MLDEGMINDRQVFMHDTSDLWVEKIEMRSTAFIPPKASRIS